MSGKFLAAGFCGHLVSIQGDLDWHASKTQGKQKKKAKVDKQEEPGKTKKMSSFRKRKCDAAYHSAKKKALAEGKTPQEACNVASAASAQVAKKIEKGELTEE